ncbi:efflux RND transporter periplasmic adaptor subunit [Ferrimonas aestuarii]|uniref:Efflux RND transporter periplasmic adaptor subunit n=1 Tax=Ferrimonas aestuarii TaxID=2569539 RepID=A0A4U1BQV2_9GAMM|nr:efflux RND transporter periplasmic adaptor subunit [Ferrimonas aestuarii]TKB53911.1 efflux RND transporter periplasmic adaptor subunit [Ferrimonas aestuarii]
MKSNVLVSAMAAFAAAMMPVQAADYVVAELAPAKHVVLASQVEGVVSVFKLRLGQSVDKTQPLVELDPQDAELALSLSDAELALSQADYKLKQKQLKRLQGLEQGQTLSQSELDDQQRITQVSQAQVSVDEQKRAQAQRYLDKFTIRAPFDAVVAKRLVEQGQWLSVGQPVYELSQVDTLIVRAYLIEDDLANLSVGQTLEVRIPSMALTRPARLVRMAPVMDSDAQGFAIELELDNGDRQLKPGFRAQVLLPGGEQ